MEPRVLRESQTWQTRSESTHTHTHNTTHTQRYGLCAAETPFVAGGQVLLHRWKEEHRGSFQGSQLGVGCPGGVEVVAHSLRDVLDRHEGSDLALLKIDFKNAFNMIRRQHFVKETCQIFPEMAAWTDWCYSESTMLLWNHSKVFDSGRSSARRPTWPVVFLRDHALGERDRVPTPPLQQVVHGRWGHRG